MRRQGTTFVEILVAIAILALCMIPIIEWYTRMAVVPAISEDKAHAELLATRLLERYASLSFEQLEALVGPTRTGALAELFDADKQAPWYQELPEYASSLGIGRKHYEGRVTVKRLAEGLVAIDVVITWDPEKAGARISHDYSYSLTRLVSRADLGVAYVDGEPEL